MGEQYRGAIRPGAGCPRFAPRFWALTWATLYPGSRRGVSSSHASGSPALAGILWCPTGYASPRRCPRGARALPSSPPPTVRPPTRSQTPRPTHTMAMGTSLPIWRTVTRWDFYGEMITVDSGASNGVCLTYDALGRAVEKGVGAACGNRTEIVYSPLGAKVAIMNGQTFKTGFLPLPGGAQVVYNASGLRSYRHPDWLGSSRLATGPGRSKFYDVAYAPYGEPTHGTGTKDIMFTGQNQDTEVSTVAGRPGRTSMTFFSVNEPPLDVVP